MSFRYITEEEIDIESSNSQSLTAESSAENCHLHNSISNIKAGQSGSLDENQNISADLFSSQLEEIPENECEKTQDSRGRSSSKVPEIEESFLGITTQISVPFFIAGMGMVGAGLVMDVIQDWPVFKASPEIFILIPALLGLKGNLEMTLASRLSTQANLGNLETARAQWDLSIGNISLNQVQAIVVGFLASFGAVLLGWIQSKSSQNNFIIHEALLLCSSSVMTASIASFVLGILMVGVIILSKRFNINPDNVATPIASSLGDLTTLSLLAWISTFLYEYLGTLPWVCPIILGAYVFSLPLWIWLAKRTELTEKVLYSGWLPVLSAMIISSGGGVILHFAMKYFPGIAVFQPVINGVGGDLVAIQASRISTWLHNNSQMGFLPPKVHRICSSPWTVFCAKGGHARTARVLLMLVIPGHLIFTCSIHFLQTEHKGINFLFMPFYLFAALVQVILLLYIAEVLIHCLWIRSSDPDDSAIPYLTALGDVFGTALLTLAFMGLYAVGGISVSPSHIEGSIS